MNKIYFDKPNISFSNGIWVQFFYNGGFYSDKDFIERINHVLKQKGFELYTRDYPFYISKFIKRKETGDKIYLDYNFNIVGKLSTLQLFNMYVIAVKPISLVQPMK